MKLERGIRTFYDAVMKGSVHVNSIKGR